MLDPAAVSKLQNSLFAENEDGKAPRGRRKRKKKSKHKLKRGLSASLQAEALSSLVRPSRKSEAADAANAIMLDQRKRDYLSAEMMKIMSSQEEWIGSPSSSLQLTFSSTANRHIVNKQDILNYDKFRRNVNYNNIIARGAYLAKFEPKKPRRPSKASLRRARQEKSFRVRPPTAVAAVDAERRRMRHLRSFSSSALKAAGRQPRASLRCATAKARLRASPQMQRVVSPTGRLDEASLPKDQQKHHRRRESSWNSTVSARSPSMDVANFPSLTDVENSAADVPGSTAIRHARRLSHNDGSSEELGVSVNDQLQLTDESIIARLRELAQGTRNPSESSGGHSKFARSVSCPNL